MIFNSFIFLFVFFPISILLYIATPNKYRKSLLLLISFVFIIWAYPPNVIIFLISMFFNYFLVRVMDKEMRKSRRQLIFLILILSNVSLLFIYKYLGFLVGNLNIIFKSGMYVDKLIVPIGLSFYTFQVLSYVVDVYKFKYRAETKITDLFLYFIMFPQLASGPIMRYDELKPQMGVKPLNGSLMSSGVERFIVGLFKKAVIANTLSELWLTIKVMPTQNMSALTAWVGILAFTMYIYFDFSGYMDMAIGVANIFGYKLQENFNYPYISKSVSEFWRRWHMTLGRWFRDYIYIPMGGSRNGFSKYIMAALTVWLVTGIWHGASWNFIIWGLYFGVLIIIEKSFSQKFLDRMPGFVSNTLTMILVMVGWVIFDTPSLIVALEYIKAMFGFTRILYDRAGLYYLYNYLFYFILSIILARPLFKKIFNHKKKNMNRSQRIALVLMYIIIFVVSVGFILNQSYSPSMYIGF